MKNTLAIACLTILLPVAALAQTSTNHIKAAKMGVAVPRDLWATTNQIAKLNREIAATWDRHSELHRVVLLSTKVHGENHPTTKKYVSERNATGIKLRDKEKELAALRFKEMEIRSRIKSQLKTQ